MRICIAFSLLFLSWSSLAQNSKLPRYVQGFYQGTQGAYWVQNHSEKFLIDSVEMIFNIQNEDIDICFLPSSRCIIENGIMASSYKNPLNKKEWIITLRTKDASMLEELVFNKKNKTLTRLGIYPQPNVLAKKLRKKQ